MIKLPQLLALWEELYLKLLTLSSQGKQWSQNRMNNLIAPQNYGAIGATTEMGSWKHWHTSLELLPTSAFLSWNSPRIF